MGKEIDFDSLGWTKGDDFIAFAFGDFNSKFFYIQNPIETDAQKQIKGGIIRTSNGDRYNMNLVPPMQDKTADVPGGDGQYYFGTYHKPKVFDISFAFDCLTQDGLRKLKKAFAGKEMRELVFSEESDKVYMAKVTSQPNIKTICFDETYTVTTGEGEEAVTKTYTQEVYKGEGSVQFTAYWPYARDISASVYTQSVANGIEVPKITDDDPDLTYVTKIVENEGDIPTTFVLEASGDPKVIKIEIKQGDTPIATIEAENITGWDSKTGIVKSGDNAIYYTGDGLAQIPLGLCTFKITSISEATGDVQIEFYNQYY